MVKAKTKKRKSPKTAKKAAGKKVAVKKETAAKKEKKAAKKAERYFEATGRRKTAIARVRLQDQGEKNVLINGKPLEVYFPTAELQQIVKSPLEKLGCLDKFGSSAKVKGGGYQAQAEAVRHGIARALVVFNPEFRKKLKNTGYLTRDSRMRERKKFGLKRARRAPQWQKR